MTRRNLLTILFLSLVLGAFAMTDQQVISYIKQQAAAGKSQEQIGKELVAKGVTPEQAKRIKAQYEAQMASQQEHTTNPLNRSRSNTSGVKTTASTAQSEEGQTLNSPMGEIIIEDPLSATLNQMMEVNSQLLNPEEEILIFGHDIFNTNDLSFAPNVNVGTPESYILGPGDEVIIDMWGANEEHLRQVISPEGSIMIEQIGPVYLNGLNINSATSHIKNAFSKKYSGVTDQETEIQLTLGETRTIMVNVMGEVETPGTFLVSPFSTVFNALYLAGGVNNIGSLRNIQVLRNGRKVAGVDVYDYIMKGQATGNINLQEGDVIIIPPYDQLVNISGKVKRPMYYEMRPDETIETLVEYAGGFSGDAYSGMVRLQRHAGVENELYNIEKEDFHTYHLQDGDIVTVGTVLDRYSNKVDLQGSVMRPGMYAIGPNVSSVAELIAAADGLREDAYTGRALLYREGPELQLQVLAINLDDILAGTAPDIELRKNDVLVVSSLEEIIERGTITIKGQVTYPGEYPYAENSTLEDAILAAGGLLEGASTVRIDVARRIVDPEATEQTSQLAQTFTLSIDKSLKVGSGQNFKLQPFDLINVRVSPGYEPQASVNIEGEVLFAGSYVLEKRNERISELIKRAGGVLDGAYIQGAYLERQLTESEYEARRETLRIAKMQSQGSEDSIALNKIDVAKTYNVGMDLQKALDNPGSTYDMVLQEGDRIFIPQLQSTVKIAGDVMFPNAVLYEPGKKLKYYINQAGGYGTRAKKNKAFVVYMNGTVAIAKKNTVIEPGCQIIVPSKSPSSGTNWAQIIALASSLSSIVTLGATVANLFKR